MMLWLVKDKPKHITNVKGLFSRNYLEFVSAQLEVIRSTLSIGALGKNYREKTDTKWEIIDWL